ncbi:pentapeptide repeat-containing protein [Streptomyces sp. NBC_01477]|uniref:pentapeptide repeat-containing protein n=1 Tax=Streptomyces sp. NBC_01477 TaxID=2976015 RepID=UPI002E2FB438|nr:pentapeptide repeat-containing protein [Streptomyces sp. NBC_01477]
MDSRHFGAITVTLPDLAAAGSGLDNVSRLDTTRGSIEDFQYIGERLRDLDLTATRLLNGRLGGIEADRVRMEETQLHSVEFTGCTAGALRCAGSKLSRVVFRDCTFMGATFEDSTFDNVLFEGCRLDYAVLAKVRATGPVAFSACSLVEAELTGNDLADETAIDGCVLRATDFRPGNYRGVDLRGSDLSAVSGAVNLTGVIISPGQEHQLARALLAGLDLTVTDEGR